VSGYIKLHRAVRGTAIAQHPEYFAAWVHLLCMASHKSHQQIVGTKIIDLEPGQLVFGRQRFSATTGISENKIRSALLVLKELHMITSKSHAKFSIISITNWSKYQDSPPANNHETTSKPPANHHKQECIKNEENKDLPKNRATVLDYSSWPEPPDQQILADWKALRKNLKAPVSQTVVTRFGNQLSKARDLGFSVDDCLGKVIEKGWKGFSAEWMANDSQQSFGGQQAKRTIRDFPQG